MSEFLDYEGLEHYHEMLKNLLQSIEGGSSAAISEKIKSLYNLPQNDPTLDDIFENILYRLSMNGKALITLKLALSDGTPLVGFAVSGIDGRSGQTATTDSDGFITGYVSPGTKTLSAGGYSDLSSYSKSYTFVAGETYYDEWTTFTQTNYISVTSSKTLTFSALVDHVEYSIVGGGGGGSRGSSSYNSITCGTGGGGGYCVTGTLTPNVGTSYSASVGSGGSGAGSTGSATGTAGGSSSFAGRTASGGSAGGSGGGGNGSGGSGSSFGEYANRTASSGKSGSGSTYTSYSGTALVGGGGGGGGGYFQDYVGGSSRDYSGASGGSPNGGAGATVGSGNNSGSNGRTYGGGGGGAGGYLESENTEDGSSYHGSASYSAGSGAAGHVGIRIYFK